MLTQLQPKRVSPHERHRVVGSLRGLSLIRRAGVDVCVCRRTADPGLAAWLDALANGGLVQSVDVRGVTPARDELEGWLSTVAAHPLKDVWVDDLWALLSFAPTLVGSERLRVQLGVLDSRKCPRFHVDNVGVRLLCTYAGEGTEWIAERDLDRERLRSCAVDEAPLRRGAVQQVQRFDVLTMKGSAWPGNRAHGAVHRSPAASSVTPRLVLTIDAAAPRPS